ncbi:STM3941 family protein [Chryseobacterium sp. JJR-5R]|uniref:STM3941 family protein n=1 Tax=Chryseobacterium sp. JJR-5R TaxID=3093923 RepID=UPI002A75DABC|nr:STM3941 family protein [Chryseobacterium sp. JJR-5R]WPO81607.1 STM3941 family protein [Chryseobacterium sp. JJR-5R]
MSDIIFKKNKLKYLFIIILLLAILFSTLYFSTLFVLSPSKYLYTLMPNVIVFFVGILGFLGCSVLLYIIVKSIFNKEFFIRINKNGLFIGIIQYSNKLINWNDIIKIEIIEINSIQHIIIYIKNIEHYKSQEKGIQKYFFESRTKKYDTPFVINTSALSSNANDIMESIVSYWKKFK